MNLPEPPPLSRAEKEALLQRLLSERAARKKNVEKIEEQSYRVELFPEYRSLQKMLAAVRAETGGNAPYFQLRDGLNADTIETASGPVLNFSSYNYLGLAGHASVMDAAKAAIDRYGTSVSASRLSTGEIELHRKLERELAAFLEAEDAITYVGGHATNVTTVGQLMGHQDVVFYDSLIHNSVLNGVSLSGARGIPFQHNDTTDLRRCLKENRGRHRRALIVAEGVYSMDGDIADLPGLIELKQKFNALLMIDEAHSLGVLGERGGGIREHCGVPAAAVDIWMGTLSKSLASCGGYVAGSRALVEFLKYRASGFVYSVGMTPPNTAAALASLQVLRREPERVAELRRKGRLFLDQAKARGLDTGHASGAAIIPIILGDSNRCMRTAAALIQAGVNALPVTYPVVPEESSRLRFFINYYHSDQQILKAVEAVAGCLRTIE